jgi:hypothetical protein
MRASASARTASSRRGRPTGRRSAGAIAASFFHERSERVVTFIVSASTFCAPGGRRSKSSSLPIELHLLGIPAPHGAFLTDLESVLRVQRMLAAALEAEVAAYLAQHESALDESGRRLVVRNGHSRIACLTMVFKLAQAAERKWRKLDGYELLGDVIRGVQFKDGTKVAA